MTPTTTLESPRKFGPPESPKHVPPVFALLDNMIEKSPVNPVLTCRRCGSATMRTRSAWVFHAAAVGKAFWSP